VGLEGKNFIISCRGLRLTPMKQSDDSLPSDLAVNIAEAANFATYFTGSLAAQSTPHLYISSLVTWSQESTMSQNWKSEFSRAPSFKQTTGGSTVSLMIIQNQSLARSVAFSSDGTRIVSGSFDKSVRVWDASTGAEMTRLNGHTSFVNSVAFSSDGTRIVSGSEDESVRVWDASTGAEMTRLNGHTSGVISVAFSSDGTRIVSGSYDKSVRVWDASTGAEMTRLNGHNSSVRSVAFSTDGTCIVSGSYDRSVRVWDASTSAELARLNGHASSVNPTMLSHTVTATGYNSVLTFDTVHYCNHWTSTIDNWIVGLPHGERLMWVHPQIQEVLCQPYNLLSISRAGSATIEFAHSKIGMEWAECRTSLSS
jgi:WD40 repeat protein